MDKSTVIGPVFYTKVVVKVLQNMSDDPVERILYSKMLKLLEAGNLNEFQKFPESPGLAISKEAAIAIVAEYLDSQADWLDVETKVKGRAEYARKVREKLKRVADEVGFKGSIDAIVSHLVNEAARYYGW